MISRFSTNLFVVLLLITISHLHSPIAFAQQTLENLILEGRITDSTSGEAVVGASVRIVGRNAGTYSTAKGFFRLPIPQSTTPSAPLPLTLRISSLGYKPLEYTFNANATKATLVLRLASAPITLGSVEVRALSAEDIVRRAIAARAANAGNLLSVTKTLYSKINGFFVSKLPFRDERRQEIILESISRIEDTYKPKREQKTTILQRRQTANIPAQNNIFAFNEFFNFQDDNIKLASARLTTPLSSNAPNVYIYEFLGQKPDGNDGMVFQIGFKPRSAAFPAFEGLLSISDRDYALVEADFRPVQVSITFIESLHYKQKFTEYTAGGQNIWIPTYLQLQIKGGTQAAMGAVKASGEFTAQTIVQNVNINASSTAITNSAIKNSGSQNTPQALSNLASSSIAKTPKLSKKATTTVVEKDVDSAKAEFWEKNSLYALSADELATYRRVDSAKVIEDSIKKVSPPKPASEQRSGVSINFSLGGGGDDDDDNEEENSDVNVSMKTNNGSGKKTNIPNTPNQATTPPMSGMLPFSVNGLLPITLTTGCSVCAALGINPMLNFTRTTNLLYGIELLPHLFDTTGRTPAALSLRGALDGNAPERRRFWGEAGVMLDAVQWKSEFVSGSVNVYGSIFSRLNAIQERRLTAPTLSPFNLNVDYLVFGNHFDFYREDGWTAGVGMVLGGLWLSASRTEARHFSLENTPERTSAGDRANLVIQAGNFRIWRVDADWNYGSVLSPITPLSTERAQFGLKIAGELGDETERTISYTKAEAGAFALVPTFATGYAPMAALLTLSAGWASQSTPIQKQFVAMRRYAVMGATHDLMSAGINAFGGKQFAQARLEHSFSDLWWRALRLPMLNERGLELSIFANAAWYGNTSEKSPIFRPTPNDSVYTELGFSIDRIPTFLLDFLFLRFDAAWGLGENAINTDGQRNFGFTISTHFSF